MEGMDRRSALSLGLAASAIPLLAFSRPARAELAPNYSPTDGEEIAPGVRVVEVGSQVSDIPAYSDIQVVDIVFQPGARDPAEGATPSPMDTDMICFILAGSFRIENEGQEPFEVKEGEFYSCGKGTLQVTTNTGSGVGIHRAAVLKSA